MYNQACKKKLLVLISLTLSRYIWNSSSYFNNLPCFGYGMWHSATKTSFFKHWDAFTFDNVCIYLQLSSQKTKYIYIKQEILELKSFRIIITWKKIYLQYSQCSHNRTRLKLSTMCTGFEDNKMIEVVCCSSWQPFVPFANRFILSGIACAHKKSHFVWAQAVKMLVMVVSEYCRLVNLQKKLYWHQLLVRMAIKCSYSA